MPSKQEHLNKAEHNERFANQFTLNTTPYLDWVVTAFFYSAIHFVEAYLATISRHSTDHRVRDSDMQRNPKLRTIYDEYSNLKNDSTNARYYTYSFKPTAISLTTIPDHNKIKTYILSLI